MITDLELPEDNDYYLVKWLVGKHQFGSSHLYSVQTGRWRLLVVCFKFSSILIIWKIFNGNDRQNKCLEQNVIDTGYLETHAVTYC